MQNLQHWLFRKGPNKGGIDPNKQDKVTIHKVNERHFSEFAYGTFSQTFRRKCHKWNTNQDLSGRRRGRQSQQKQDSSSDSSDDSSYDESEEEDISLGSVDSSDSSNEEEEEMPPKKKAAKAKTPPRKKTPEPRESTPRRAARKKAPAIEESEVEDLVNDLDTLEVATPSFKSWEMNYVFPRVRYQYIMNRIQRENFEFFVPTFPNDFYKTWIDDTGWWLYLKVRIAPVFTHPNRLMYAFQSETNFNQDTHANTAYQEVCKEVDKEYEANSEGSKEIWTVPVRFRLKFKCLTNEKDLLWEVQSFPNNHISVDEFGGQQWFSCLLVCVTSVEQPKSTNKGGRRIVEAGDSLDALQGFGTPTNSGMDTGS